MKLRDDGDDGGAACGACDGAGTDSGETGVWAGGSEVCERGVGGRHAVRGGADGVAARHRRTSEEPRLRTGIPQAQTESALKNIETILKREGLTMADVVQMDVFLAADPAKDNKMDFAGMNAAYSKYFGTADQPNKPVRAAMQVAALATPWGLVEIQVVAVKE